MTIHIPLERKSARVCALLSWLLVLSGCNGPVLPTGHFSGSLLTRPNTQSQVTATFVSENIAVEGGSSGNITVLNAQDPAQTAPVTPGTALNTLDIEGVVLDYIATAVRQGSILASFRVARSNLDRLLYRNFYQAPAYKLIE
jgi:hypothetical protein